MRAELDAAFPHIRPITNKHRNYKHLKAGLFGNRLRVWDLDSYLISGFGGRVAIRYLADPGGRAWCFYDLRSSADVLARVDSMLAEGAVSERITINEQAPHDALVVQGEVSLCPEDNLAFLYSTVKDGMRLALAKSATTVHGLLTRVILNQAMTPSSAEDFWALSDMFPKHVVEVSVFSKNLGDLPGRNSIVWEVRRY